MKIRNGFVSNSSSSSFCISYKKGQYPRQVVEIDLRKYEDSVIKTVAELNEYVLDQSCFDDIKTMLEEDDYWSKKYKEMLLALTNGDELLIGNVGSEGDDGLEQHIYNKGLGVLIDCKKVWDHV